MKLCKDCKHFIPRVGLSPFPDRCDSGSLLRNPIHGGPLFSCVDARASESMCGIGGRYFEEAPKRVRWWQRIASSRLGKREQ